MSSDKRRRARTQGRFSDPRCDNSRNKEKSKRPSDHFDPRLLNIEAQSSYENVQSTNSCTFVNNVQEVRCKNSSEQVYQPKQLGLLDFQTRNWTTDKKSLSANSCLDHGKMCQENLEKRDKSLEYGNDPSYNTKEETLIDNSEEAMESAAFTKNLFTYEPTKLEETVKEKKTKRISDPGWHTLSIEPSGRSEVYFKQDFINEVYQKAYFDHLNKYIKWELKEVNSYGTKYPQPRMVAWFGPFPYGYSGVLLKANNKFPEIVLEIKNKIEDLLKLQRRTVTFNSVLLNKYRDGKDGVAWHSDNELSMGVDPLIASVSLGETRKFEMKKKQLRSEESNKDFADYVIYLESGSLLLMDGVMQQDWLHRVPKEYHDKSTRINLTFRTVYPIDQKKIFQKFSREYE
ncbi:alpha-ketoglutarate-dependent dioxygenase alkB homolog 3-like [Centruroides sculpturatus]|uniref:alpha-ketoglutarate-dependent dioxygenase alkB homolog 3-like n=1 Tax=Centruroides sculpturatus TaxID=218467 RepID=UPI000C6EEBE6|nr:alpha-ketoglutarate-dependent dioxygenase alkB homolog 3-like [Centruroides sculpturatus]